MKKRIMSILFVLCVMFTMVPTTAFAAKDCPMASPDGTTRAWGGTKTYAKGEAFRSSEVSLEYHLNKKVNAYKGKLEFWANGVSIKNGYKFTEVGQKVITVKGGKWVATYELQVIPVLKDKWQNIEKYSIQTQPAKTSYRQGADGFDPKDIVVRCEFKNGTTQDLGYQDLEFYAGKRGMKNYKSGKAIKSGYLFTEVGEKDLIVRVANKEMRIPFTVTQFTTKEITKAEMIKEPGNFNYKVGEAFRAGDYAVRCYYADGSTEDFTGNALNITANGVQLYDGYKFVADGKKNLVIRIGDFSTNYTLTVSKKEITKAEMIKEPANFDYKVGEAFRANDFTVRCYYADGSTEDLNGDALTITANGVKLYEGYKFVSAGKKNLLISVEDYSINYTVNVSK